MQNKIVIGSIAVIAVLGALWYGITRMVPTKMTDVQTQKIMPRTITVKLDQQNNSGETGIATLTEINGKTNVILRLNGYPAGISQPAHIHTGACANIGGVRYPLAFPMNGSSETILDISIDSLLVELPLAVNVHKSTQEAGIYYACGNIMQ